MKRLGIPVRMERLEETYKYFINESYIKRILDYGWLPIPLVSLHEKEIQLASLDALLLPGGYDICSYYFNKERIIESTHYTHPQDHFDLMWCHAFVKAKKPILGICRGMQIINTYFHGTLHQHLSCSTHEESSHKHLICPCPHTIFTQLLAPKQPVNSFHHQAVDQLGKPLCAGAYSNDGVLEALFHPELPILGVQWHPEQLEDDTILPYFFDVLNDNFHF